MIMGRQLKIIIRTPNYIGDTIMMLPALELVRKEYPEAAVTIVCQSHSEAIFRNKKIAEVIVDDTKGENRFQKTITFIHKLRKEVYDIGILFHNSFFTALIFRLARVKYLIGYKKEGRGVLLNYAIKMDRNWHYTNQYAHLVNQYFRNKYEVLPRVELYSKPSRLVAEKGKPNIGFVLGGENKGARSYPKNLALELFSLLNTESHSIVLLGDSQDMGKQNTYARFLEERGEKCINLTGETSVEEFIDAIAALDLLVTIDTSAMHIAAAVGTEFVLLSGKGTSPLCVVYPKNGKGHIMHKGQHCVRGEDMIAKIAPKDIYDKIQEIVNKIPIFGNASS